MQKSATEATISNTVMTNDIIPGMNIILPPRKNLFRLEAGPGI